MAVNGTIVSKFQKLSIAKCSQSWARTFAFFSKDKSSKSKSDVSKDKPESEWDYEMEKNAADHGKPKEFSAWLDEPIPDHWKGDHLPNPVRNTEREYYQTHLNPNWEGHKRGFDSRFYSKKHGIKKEVYAWLHWDLNINDNDQLIALQENVKWRQLKEDQRYLEDRVKAVGHELGAAHFIVARGGAVKFHGRDLWFAKDKNNKYALPRHLIENLKVEAIVARNMDLTYVGFDNLANLAGVRYIKFDNCPYIDDWCLSRLRRMAHSLEFVDIRNCPQITDNGIATMAHLPHLQGLHLSNLVGVRHLGLLTLLLEELKPDLKTVGITEEDLKSAPWSHRGERRLVKALLGLVDAEDDEMERTTGAFHIDHIPTEEEYEQNPLARGVRRVD